MSMQRKGGGGRDKKKERGRRGNTAKKGGWEEGERGQEERKVFLPKRPQMNSPMVYNGKIKIAGRKREGGDARKRGMGALIDR